MRLSGFKYYKRFSMYVELQNLLTQRSLAERSKALPGERLCTKIHKETVAKSQLSSTRKKSRKICLQWKSKNNARLH